MERVTAVAVDTENNYYYLAEVGGFSFTFGEMEFDTYNDFADSRDVFILSTDENGNFRWSKTIGGGWDERGAVSIGVDGSNAVYVSGSALNVEGNTPVHFDTDSVMPEGSNTVLAPTIKGLF